MTLARSIRWLPWFALLAAVAVVELGWRQPSSSGVGLPELPGIEGWIDRLRAAPFAAIDDPSAASLVSGIVLGRTQGIDPVTQTAFLDSGLWHLLAASGQNVGLVAMRDIAAGEELTTDYALFDDYDGWMECHCGADACRRVIDGRDWTMPELQNRYRGWFSTYLQRRIDASG